MQHDPQEEAMPVEILSPQERRELLTIPELIHDSDLVRFFTLSPAGQAISIRLPVLLIGWIKQHTFASCAG